MIPGNQKLIRDGEETLPFVMDHLPKFAQEKAEKELKETPENLVKGLSDLRLMLKDNDSTRDIKFHEDFLRQFLRHSKYNVKKSFTHLQNFINLRKKYSNLFQGVSPDDLSMKTSYKLLTVLPKRCPEGCTIICSRIGEFDVEEMPIEDFKRLQMLSILQPLRDPMTQINGFKIIHDFDKTSLKHLRYCTPQNLMFQYHAAMDCFPGRYKGIHFVNESFLLRILWGIVKQFISPKMRNRVFFHSSPNELLDHFPRSVLPTEYGGDLKDYYMGDYIKNANKDYGQCTMEGQANYF